MAIPIFLIMMYIMFEATYVLGSPFQELIEQGFAMLSGFVASFIPNYYVASFICDVVICGVGGVISFRRLLL